MFSIHIIVTSRLTIVVYKEKITNNNFKKFLYAALRLCCDVIQILVATLRGAVHQQQRAAAYAALLPSLPQTGIAAPTLTAMQGFEAKRKIRVESTRTIAVQAGVEPGCYEYNLNAVTILLRNLHQPIIKMSYFNQMYEKGNVSIREEKNTVNVPFAKSLRI